MRVVLAMAAAAVLGACGPSADMPPADAYAVLEEFARGDAPADICTPEGQTLLRSATRSYARGQASEGKPWPDIQGMAESDGASVSEVDMMVLAALAAGFIESSDVRGPAAAYASFASVADVQGQVRNFRQAMRHACKEVFELQQESARLSLETQRYQRAVARAEGQSPERVAEVHRRFGDRIRSGHRRVARLNEELAEKLEELGYAP